MAALAMLFATTSCVSIATAHEDSVPMIITEPEDPEAPIECAVFFADNMVYTPQWRIGNLVRIEAMVVNMTDRASPEEHHGIGPERVCGIPGSSPDTT